jgi:hypothetical protein
MVAWWVVAALFVVSAGISYSGMQSAKKQAKKAADAMAGVLINKESNIEPLPVIYGTRRVGGVRVFVSTKDVSGGDKNEFLYIALALCEGEVNSITDIRIDDKPITDSQYSGLHTINVHLGADNQNYDPLLTEANAGWTSSHKLSGVAYLAIKLKWDADAFGGVPEITALVQGRKVYDPRSPSAANAYSDNPALCIRDYLTNARFGKGLPSSAIDDTAFSTAATDCDTSVTYYTNGTNGKIFQTHAVLQTDETIFSNIKIMLQGCRGFLPFTQGKYGLKIDKSSSSVYAFTTDTIIGGISVKGEEKKDKFNRVIVKFPNADVLYQPDQAVWPDAGSSEETAYLAQDNGTLLVQNLDLETVTNYYVARDLARVMLLRSRNSLRTSFRASSEAIQLSVGDVVNITHPTPAWTAKPFQIEEITLNYDGTCNINAVEYDPSIYTYDTSAQETVYPDTDLPNPFFVAPPRSLSATASTSVALDGTIVTSINLAWLASLDSFVNQYDVQFSTDNTNFQSVITDELKYVISPVESGATYYARVRGINSLGVKSAFITANQGSVGDTTAPALPTSLSATAGYKSISLKWTNPSDKDFSNVEVYRSTSSGGSFVEVATIGGGWGQATEFLNGGLTDATAFYYKFKAVDYSGNRSASTAEVTATTNAAAINGDDGKSTFTAPIFKRATSAPSAPTGGTFNFGTNTLTAPTGWSTTVPSGTDPIYQANFQFSISGDTGTVTAGTWSTPVVIAENGGDGTDGLSTFVFPVYKRSDGAPTAPSGGSYDFTNNEITAPSGWSSSVPSGTDPIYVSTTQAQISGATGTDSSLTWTSPILFVQNGISGSDGKSTFTAPIFKRATSAPSAPSGGSFNFGNNTLTPPTGWAIAVPSGTNPIYQANFQFSISGDTGTVTAGTWSTPVIIAENGGNGTDGLSTFTFAVHKRASSTPSSPSGGSYNFGTNEITAPSGWSEAIPSGTDPIYISSTRAQISGATGTDSSLNWTAPIVFAINGDNGGDGVNTAPVYAYKRSSSTLASTNKPTDAQTWTFADASFGDNDLGNGWTGDIPTGNDDLYICAAVASSTSTTYEVVAADWSAPQVLGTKGINGTNGYNTAVVYAYKRSASTVTDKPDEDRVWTFSDGTWDNNVLGNSFTGTIPSGTNDLYVCTAVAASQSSTDTVTGTSDWGSPQLLALNGINGAAGPRNAQGFLYYSVSGSQPSAPTATSFNFSTGSFSGLTANWSRTPPEITGGDAAYWATSFTVVEATLNGNQTKTFSTPFSSFAFDGLVTFSNLNDELADGTSGSEITTINGARIQTGTLDVSQVNISGTTQSNFNLQSAGSGSRMKITNDTIEIYEGSVLRVKIGNL